MTPLVSLVINNYNYERFLGDAIESALAQTYPNTEVIVIDDGSTDGSKSVIALFGDRVKAVYKENGGQGSAFNEGLGQVQGAIVIFLDADDVLAPEVVQMVVDAFANDSGLVCVRWRLELIDEVGNSLGATNPGRDIEVPVGDLSQRIIRHGWRYATPPTSGNAFLADCLRTFFPIPPEIRRCCDVYLFGNVAMRGRLGFIDETLGSYRQHVMRKGHFRLSQAKVIEELGAADVTDQSVAMYIKQQFDSGFDCRAQWGFVGDEVLRIAVYRFAQDGGVGAVLPPTNCLVTKKSWSINKKIKWLLGALIVKLAPTEGSAYWLVGVMLKKHNIFGQLRHGR